jgi:hypothetical protein
MRFRVRGVERQTGRPIKPVVIEADDERQALAEASRRGILVEAIQKL